PPVDEEFLHHLRRGALRVRGLFGAGGDLVGEEVLDHGLEQFFLAREVEVQRALGDAGGARHLLAARRGEALLDEQREGGLEKLGGAGFLAAAPERTMAAEFRWHS